jgi:hypothetical protein
VIGRQANGLSLRYLTLIKPRRAQRDGTVPCLLMEQPEAAASA